MEEQRLDSIRSFEELMRKNKERGLIDRSTISSLKNIGIDITDDDIISEDKKKKIATGRMHVSSKMLRYQRENGAYRDASWRPDSIIYHTDEFFDFINSMTFGDIKDKIFYEPFERYKAQAQYWYETSRNPHESTNHEEKKEIILEEYNRIDSNTLYYSMQYGMFIDGTRREGKAKYVAKEHNAVIFFLLDCGYSFMFGKPRQIFATTTIAMYASKKLLTQENFFMKYISMDVDTGMEILNDKLKPVLGLLPNWLRVQASRDFNKGIHLGRKIGKGVYATPNSRIQVTAPTKTAINGGSPSIVFVDEMGAIPELIAMVLEARPTMYIDVNQDGNLTMARQLVLFGTGVSDNKGKEAFKTLWTSTLSLWEKKDFRASLFIPLFFSWGARCGADTYEAEKKIYYSGETDLTSGFSEEERKQIFHMHYPTRWHDMFGVAANKLVSRDVIESNSIRIRNTPAREKPIDGYFEPVFDQSQKYDDNMYVPFKIIGASFIPFDDSRADRDKISSSIYVMPDKRWKNRFYKGTDPVMTDTGLSNFASVIWDAENCLPACVLNYRKSYDHKSAFLQSLLMALYYDTSGKFQGVPELVENNIGINYRDFCEGLGFAQNFVWNKQLPLNLQGGGTSWGVNTVSKTKNVIVGSLSEVVLTYGDNFMHDVIFKQLDSYTQVKGTWQPVDKRMYKDDVLDALSLSYICRNVYRHLLPTRIEVDESKMNFKIKWITHRLQDGSLTRIQKRIAV